MQAGPSKSRFIFLSLLIVAAVLAVIVIVQLRTGVPEPQYAMAVLRPTEGSQVKGEVYFEQKRDTVQVTAALSGLRPNSLHGFHIHEFGDCSAPDASSAGGHYSPSYNKHGDPEAPFHHAGDLGNLRADASGEVFMTATFDSITVNGADNPVVGRSVIVHAEADDFVTQPTGGAGKRLACGVIEAVSADVMPNENE